MLARAAGREGGCDLRLLSLTCGVWSLGGPRGRERSGDAGGTLVPLLCCVRDTGRAEGFCNWPICARTE